MSVEAASAMLGTPIYMGAGPKDLRAPLERSQAALEQMPLAFFALGPIRAEDGVEGSREQLDAALAKLPQTLEPQTRWRSCRK